MISLSSISTSSTTITTKRLIAASIQPKHTTSVDVPSQPSAGVPRIRKNTANNNLQTTTKPKQPSVAEVERAIGAGMFRDRDSRGSGEKPTLFDFLSDTPMAQPESPLEKKLRETGEWVLEATEGGPNRPRSAGHEILMVICLWILPVWMISMSVAFGLVKLPFSIPGLDDLLM